MSVGFLLESKDDAVIWRGPKKNGYYICINSNKYYYMINIIEFISN